RLPASKQGWKKLAWKALPFCLSPSPFRQQIGAVVRQIGSAFDGCFFHAVFDDGRLEGRAHKDGLTDDALLPCDRFAIGIKAGTHGMRSAWTVVSAAHVILARPHDLDRHLDGFGTLHCFRN